MSTVPHCGGEKRKVSHNYRDEMKERVHQHTKAEMGTKKKLATKGIARLRMTAGAIADIAHNLLITLPTCALLAPDTAKA